MSMFSFDYFNTAEIPNFSLTNPDGTVLYNLGTITDRALQLRYNGLSTLTFDAPAYIDGVKTDYYDYVEYRRLVSVENVGVFMITGLELSNDGITELKKVTCNTLESELSLKKLSIFTGTYKFYDLVYPGPTLLGNLLNYLPDWTVADVDAELTMLYRTFDINDKTIYDFLQNDVSQTYQCVFEYDTINKTISAHVLATVSLNTDIYLSYDNLVQNTDIKESTDQLVTALSVYGADPLSINIVNPLGTSVIYNFAYYMNTDWMSQGLIDALTAWQNNINIQQPIYADLLQQAEDQNTILLTEESDLVTLQGELAVFLEEQKVRIKAGQSIKDINVKIKAKKVQIKAKKSDIAATQAILNGLSTLLTNINSSLSFANNFTTEEQTELSHFIIGSTYTNPNFIQTDIMTTNEIRAEMQELYDQAVLILEKISQPRYTFTLDSTNFVFLKEYQKFIDQLKLGHSVTIEFSKEKYAYVALMGIDFNYDAPEDFKLIFSNRLRLDDSALEFADLFNQSINSGLTTTFQSEVWNNWNDNYKDDVSHFIASALDASKNMLMDSVNQEFTIDSTGLHGKYLDPATGDYGDDQIWIIDDLIAFTDDSWDSAKLALGKILTPSGTYAFGLVAQVIVGNLIAGNELLISNENNTFTVDGSGATLVNATLSLLRDDGNSKIFLDPNLGIAIQKRNTTSGSYANQFWVDDQGNVLFSGNLQAANGTFIGEIIADSGYIGGWKINPDGLTSPFGDYINSTGKIRLGVLEIDGNQGWFHGDFYAENLQGLLQAYQIGSLNADVINAGTIRGIDIYGSRIMWDGVTMYSPSPGTAGIQSIGSISLNSGYAGYGSVFSAVVVDKTFINVASDTIMMGNQTTNGQIFLNGSITTTDPYFNSGTGISGTFVL